jgi:hypothetical protein
MQSALHLKPVTGACMGPVGKVANSYDQRDGEHGRPAAVGDGGIHWHDGPAHDSAGNTTGLDSPSRHGGH